MFFSFKSLITALILPIHALSCIALIELPLKLKNPELTSDFMSFRVFPLIYRRLFRYKPDINFRLQIQGDVVQQWSQKGLKSFEFQLNKNIFFHDGSPITAYEVGKILHLYQKSKLYNQSPLARIVEIREKSPQKIEVLFSEPEPFFLDALTSVMLFKNEKNQLIGSGPMKVVSEISNETVLEEVSLQSMGRRKVVLRYLNDEVLRYYQLTLGIADVALGSMGASKTAYLMKKPAEELNQMGLQLLNSPAVALQYLGMNVRTPFLSKALNRKCLAGSIHFEEIQKARLFNVIKKTNSILIPLKENQVSCPKFSSEKLTLITPSDLHYLDLAKLVAYQIEQLGIKVKVQPMEMGFYLRALKEGAFDLFLGRNPFTISALNYAFLVQEGGYLDRIGASKASYQQRYQKIMHEPNQSKREAQIQNFEQMLISEEQLLVPLWYWTNTFIGKKNLKEINLYPSWDLTTLIEMKGI